VGAAGDSASVSADGAVLLQTSAASFREQGSAAASAEKYKPPFGGLTLADLPGMIPDEYKEKAKKVYDVAVQAKDALKDRRLTHKIESMRQAVVDTYHSKPTVDMNGRLCERCDGPLPERTNRSYSQRTDCGIHSPFVNDANGRVPLSSFRKPATNGFCELNVHKSCADGLHNKDMLYMAKSVDLRADEQRARHDAKYCLHNGWLEPSWRAKVHNFDEVSAAADEWCAGAPRELTGWPSMTLEAGTTVLKDSMDAGEPSESEAMIIGGWACAMGSAACDIAYCAYSFCDLGHGRIGVYDECEGWDPLAGVPA